MKLIAMIYNGCVFKVERVKQERFQYLTATSRVNTAIRAIS